VSFCELLHIDLNRLVRTYTRGQLLMLAHASRLLYKQRPDDEDEDEESRWLRTADTRQMTLEQYKDFLRRQTERLTGRRVN